MEPIKLLFAGDFCIRHDGADHMTPEEIPELARQVREMTSKYDISVVNVETVFTDNPTPAKKSGPNIASPMAALDLLDAYKFTVGAFANNHTMDQGYETGRKSYEAVKERGLECVGFGKNLEEAFEPYRTIIKGKKISIFNFAENEFIAATEFSPGFAPIDFIKNAKLIREEKKTADYVIVYLHSGSEHCPYPRVGEIEYTHALADEGADAIIISHPHCPQGYEYYKGVPIVYSLGNFFMAKKTSPGEEESTWSIGYMADLEITDDKITVTPVPYEFGCDCSWFKFLEGEKKEKFLQYIEKLSKVITDTPKEEYEKLKHAWTVVFMEEAKEGYLDSFLNNKKYYEDLLYCIRNCFSCETHAEVFYDYFVLLTENRLGDYDKYVEILRGLQKRPI